MNKMRSGFTILFIFSVAPLLASFESDSGKKEKDGKKYREPKHYFSNTIWMNHYSSNNYKISNPKIDTLGNYSFKQLNTAFYFPLWTKDVYKKDSTIIANHHLLLTGNFVYASPEFSGLKVQHTLYKSALGFRYIYNNGDKNIWFFDLGSFTSGDNTLLERQERRSTSVIVFNHVFKDWLSMKIGVTKTFLFGDRLHLPVLGVRIGRLDGVYASVTFPRNISLNFPMGRKLSASLFVKPMGGIYNFANSVTYTSGKDTILYNGSGIDSTMIIFGRYEYLGGMRLDFTPSKHFSLFVSGGVTSGNWIGFASYQNDKDKFKRISVFAGQPFSENSGFFNFGMTFRFGRTKNFQGNINMYELFYLNNEFDPGDNNDGAGNGDIPKQMKEKKMRKLSYKDIEDFVDEGDLN